MRQRVHIGLWIVAIACAATAASAATRVKVTRVNLKNQRVGIDLVQPVEVGEEVDFQLPSGTSCTMKAVSVGSTTTFDTSRCVTGMPLKVGDTLTAPEHASVLQAEARAAAEPRVASAEPRAKSAKRNYDLLQLVVLPEPGGMLVNGSYSVENSKDSVALGSISVFEIKRTNRSFAGEFAYGLTENLWLQAQLKSSHEDKSDVTYFQSGSTTTAKSTGPYDPTLGITAKILDQQQSDLFHFFIRADVTPPVFEAKIASSSPPAEGTEGQGGWSGALRARLTREYSLFGVGFFANYQLYDRLVSTPATGGKSISTTGGNILTLGFEGRYHVTDIVGLGGALRWNSVEASSSSSSSFSTYDAFSFFDLACDLKVAVLPEELALYAKYVQTVGTATAKYKSSSLSLDDTITRNQITAGLEYLF